MQGIFRPFSWSIRTVAAVLYLCRGPPLPVSSWHFWTLYSSMPSKRMVRAVERFSSQLTFSQPRVEKERFIGYSSLSPLLLRRRFCSGR